MTVPRVLLLTGTPPGYPQSAGVFLQDLCLSYPRDKIFCFAVILPIALPFMEDLKWLPTAYTVRPRQRGIAQFGANIDNMSGFLLRRYAKLIHEPSLVNRIVQFGKQHNIEMVWAVLNAPILINITGRVATGLGARLVNTIWDPPEFRSKELSFSRFEHNSFMREFANVLLMSERCGVASEAMAEEYKKRYGVESVVLIHGVHPNLMKPAAKELSSDSQFTIGFIGAWYAKNEWLALLSALSSVNWRIEGRNVIVRVLSTDLSVRGYDGIHIEYLGWRSVEETVDLLSQVDIAYLPYWFDETYSLSVRLCFPNKLSTYLAAGRPVLFHGPEDSSVARFLRRFPAGLCCHSLESTEIIDSLRKFIVDKEFYASATHAGQAAREQELNLRVFRQRFASLIGIGENDLLPLT